MESDRTSSSSSPKGWGVNFSAPRSFVVKFRSKCKETFFPDDPFKPISQEPNGLIKTKKTLEYFVPIFEWLPKYNLQKLWYDLLAGITITSLAVPQGISYANLASIPPIIGLYSSFVPPFVYAVLGSSNTLAVGTVAACSLLISEIFGEDLLKKDPNLYLHLIFTSTFITGVFQFALGFFRLGILVDFLSHSTITGFMGGTAIIILLQQLKGVFGIVHFTHRTDVVSVLHALFTHRDEWKWQSALAGLCFLIFLQSTRYIKKIKPRLFWVSAMGPMVVVLVGCLVAYLVKGTEHGIQTVGPLKKGLNPPSIQYLTFDAKYLPLVIKAGIVTGLIAMAEGMAIGRSFAVMKNEQTDGNKEMIAFGLMNIIGSFTSCYLTTGPFSKTAVNYNAGTKTPMSNVVMGLCMMLVLLFLAPLFSYTPLVGLSAIIMSAMLGLIDYEEMYHLFKVDKFDFLVCMSAFFGVSFLSMDYGLIISVGLSVVRALLYVARPSTCKLGRIPNSVMFRDIEQYPGGEEMAGFVILQLGSPIFFANSTYVRERILRWIGDEHEDVEFLLLDLSGVSSIDMTGMETLLEVRRILVSKGIKMVIINPRFEVLEKMMLSHFVEKIGKEYVFLSIDGAVQACRFNLSTAKPEPCS
ncbi:putative sulfate transporter 3.5 [Raphanus sativus]|uniref:Probable sulfate transporter 3.5 n=1 Tax=Raphanus sativus TaxID=3726 RepID=A0A6J0MJI7_RAPSA|nr:probable sulfate transporter 3.5 [Raphanus sativus]KAJ4908207.1 putative sulfate transporter 3.5 [Raphanus sativus]